MNALRITSAIAFLAGAGSALWSLFLRVRHPYAETTWAPTSAVLFCLLGVLLHVLYVRALRKASRIGRCPKCGYDLEGLTSPRCPECGTVPAKSAITQAGVTDAHFRRRSG